MSNYQDGKFDSAYGVIVARNPGSFEQPKNVRYFQRVGNKDYVQNEALTNLLLQGPALRSFREAELATTPKKLRLKGKIRPILITGIGGRDYDAQKALWLSDPGRFAHPDGSLHVEYIAVDIHSGQSLIRRTQIKRALKKRGWHYAVDGEPWHASFRLAG